MFFFLRSVVLFFSMVIRLESVATLMCKIINLDVVAGTNALYMLFYFTITVDSVQLEPPTLIEFANFH